MGIYDIARHCLGMLLAMAPATDAPEIEHLDSKLWPDADTLRALQRHCFAVAADLAQCEAYKMHGGGTAAHRAVCRCVFSASRCCLLQHNGACSLLLVVFVIAIV